MDSKRYTPQKELPPYAFVPGKNPHPEKPGGHMEDVEVEVSPLTESDYDSNVGYLYGIDLFNQGFFWESHVWWEALWNEAGRKGETADFLKGLIKISAAGVKELLEHESASKGHVERAKEILEPLAEKKAIRFGLNLSKVLGELDQRNPTQVKLYLEI
ncbi:MAG: DUF309 domain-containing protein [Halobacteriovoraceae bacterium]|nr:DUF309 domain-containing protein [Halobacteriovoraceae bacterium]